MPKNKKTMTNDAEQELERLDDPVDTAEEVAAFERDKPENKNQAMIENQQAELEEMAEESQLARMIAELHTTEDSFVKVVLDMRQPLDAMRDMDERTASDETYQQLDQLVGHIERLHQDYPDGLRSIVTYSQGNIAIKDEFADYIQRVQDAANISAKLYDTKNPEALANLNKLMTDFAQAKKAGLIVDDEKGTQKHAIANGAIAPAQRGPRYEMVIGGALKLADGDQAKVLSVAYTTVTNSNRKSWSAASKEPAIVLSQVTLQEKVEELAKMAAKLSSSSGTKEKYVEQVSVMMDLMKKGYHMDVVDTNMKQVKHAAQQAVDKAENRAISNPQNTAIHKKIAGLCDQIIKAAEDPRNKAMLSGALPSPEKKQPTRISMSLAQQYKNPALDSLHIARDNLRLAISEGKKDNADPRRQKELLDNVQNALTAAKTINALALTNKGNTSQVKITQEVIDMISDRLQKEIKTPGNTPPSRK